MRKHYKLISGLICVLLCTCMIAFGVYAARYNLIRISSTVSFAPTSAKLKIIGAIADDLSDENRSANTDRNYYATNYGELVNCTEESTVATFNTWEYGELTFGNFLETSSSARPAPICFFIQLTNYVEVSTQYKISITEIASNDKIELSAFCYTEANSVVTTSEAGTKGMWNPQTTTAKTSVDSFTQREESAMTELTFASNEATTPSSVNTELSTTMLVLKLEVLDIEADINFDFSFTISTVRA